MTRVVVDRIEQGEDAFAFGDPIGCHYHWTEPAQVEAYGDQVRRLGAKVELAVDGFERTASISEEVFAGEAADALRARAGRRHEESVVVRDNLRGLGRAIDAYADVLRVFADQLDQLRAFATSRGLDVHGHKIWPPVETLPRDASQKEADAWEADWKSYQECFELKIAIRDDRRAGARELVRALADHAGVHPDKDDHHEVAAHHHEVDFGDLRRDAAEEAREAVEARDAADAARHTVQALRRREQSALDDLERLVLQDRPPEQIAAQAAKVQALHHELVDARAEARDADTVAAREQAQANRAARTLADAEAGKPYLVAEPISAGGPDDGRPLAQPATLEDRLG